MKSPHENGAAAFMMAARMTPHFRDFAAHVVHLREEAMNKALYSPDVDVRTIHAGRAQAFVEISALIEAALAGRK